MFAISEFFNHVAVSSDHHQVKLFARGQFGQTDSGSVNMRRATRYAANNISVPLGRVVDMSANGMRLLCPRKEAPAVGAIERFVVSNGSQRLVVEGQIVRVRKPLWPSASCDVGVRFIDTNQATSAALEQLGRYGFVQGGKHGTSFKSAPAESTGPVQEPQPKSEKKAPPIPEVRVAVEVGDLYDMLGVSEEASDEEIRAAFRISARASHPDASDDPEAEQIFADLAKAYKVLIDPELRAKYDELRAVQIEQTPTVNETAA